MHWCETVQHGRAQRPGAHEVSFFFSSAYVVGGRCALCDRPRVGRSVVQSAREAGRRHRLRCTVGIGKVGRCELGVVKHVSSRVQVRLWHRSGNVGLYLVVGCKLEKEFRGQSWDWKIGCRVGEARKPGPYMVGGASSSGAGEPSSRVKERNDCSGHNVAVAERSNDEAWWDVCGMSVQESCAMLNDVVGQGAASLPVPEDLASMWDEVDANIQKNRMKESGRQRPSGGGGGLRNISASQRQYVVDEAYDDLCRWLDDEQGMPQDPGEMVDELLRAEDMKWDDWGVLEDGKGGGRTELAGETSEFVAAERFMGFREGYVFKKDDRGLGYHRDDLKFAYGARSYAQANAVHTQEPLPQSVRDCALVVIRLAEQLGLETKSAATLAVEEAIAGQGRGGKGKGKFWGSYTKDHDGDIGYVEGQKRRRKGRRGNRGAGEWLLQGEVAPFSGGFKEDGLWAFDQVNPNSGNGMTKYLQVTAADVVCGQEMKRFEGQPCIALENEARRRGWAMSVQACGVGKCGGPSAGTAVAVKSHLGLANVPGLAFRGPLQHRMSVKWMGSIAKGGLFVGSIYLHSGEGLSANNLRLLEEAAGVLMALPGPWVLAGDFQVDPGRLVESGFPRLAKGVVIAPSQPTCMGNTIDYFVIAEGLRGSVHSVRVLSQSPFEPHSPVRLLLKAGLRRQNVRIQRKPFGVPPNFPSGCLNSYEGEWFGVQAGGGDLGTVGGGNGNGDGSLVGCRGRGEEADVRYARWLAAAERVWLDLATTQDRRTAETFREKAQRRDGVQEGDEDKWSTRVGGPKYIWVTAAGPPAVNAPSANKITLAWNAVLRHLKGIAAAAGGQAKSAKGAREIWRHSWRCRRSLVYMMLHRTEDCEMQDVQLWLRNMVCSEDWVRREVLGYIALVATEFTKAQDKLNARIHSEWMAWLTGGLVQGLGRQHQFLRTPEGWAPSAIGRPRHLLDKDAKESKDMADRELRLMLDGLGTEAAPLGQQAEAECQADEWGGHWGEGLDIATSVMHGGSPENEMSKITVTRLEQAVKSFPARTGLGWDAVHPRAIARLPHSLKVGLVGIFEDAEQNGRWPVQSDEVVVTLLPKPVGGFRPINLFGMLQRVWTRLRREDARAWEKKHDRAYLYAGKGRSANNVAWVMAARAELAASKKIEYAQVQLDLVKAFEFVRHDKLYEGAASLGYLARMLELSTAAYTTTRRVKVAGAVSRGVRPRRGIGAGSGLATVELKLLIIPIMDQLIIQYVGIILTVYIDDTTIEVVWGRSKGPRGHCGSYSGGVRGL